MNAVELAIKQETDGIAFYRKAAEKTAHPVGKKMFLSIIEDEKRHLEALSRILKELDMTYESASPMEHVKTVFEENKDQMMERIPATADELEALKIALEMERASVLFYQRLASESREPKQKALFERLIPEEEEHFRIFNNTLSFLTDSGNWYMWDEYEIVDGGTPWA
jgi:rubrerythrin